MDERPEAFSPSKRSLGHLIRVGVVFLTIVAGLTVATQLTDWALDRVMPTNGPVAYGTTFSSTYAQSLGLDWKKAYVAVLDDLDIRQLRIPAYWEEIEPSPGQFDFSDVDWQVTEASKRGAKVVLAIGMKLPRWPECHLPAWLQGADVSGVHGMALAMIEAVVRHYHDDSSVVSWQVENEPFLPFGLCPKPDPAFLKAEVDLVRELDSSRPITMQDAGEFSTWVPTAKYADTLGVSLYRIVWDKRLGYVQWPGIPAAYKLRAAWALRYCKEVINTEMQAEPWTTEGITAVPIQRQLKQMNPGQLESNLRFARRIGFTDIYFWGVEWWYWLKQQGYPEMWNEGKKVIAQAHSYALNH